jgi:hypothetical protein
VERLTRPLFRFDPGWLFIAAGLALCAAGVLLPAQADLHALRMQLEQLRNEESQAYARLRAHSDFMDQVDRADPALIRRLAATQLNMVPEGDKPVLLTASLTVPVTHWIESAVQVDIRPPKPAPISKLSEIANGEHRLWLFGGGIMVVFIGLVLGPGTRRSAIEVESEEAAADTSEHAIAVATLEPKFDWCTESSGSADAGEIEMDDVLTSSPSDLGDEVEDAHVEAVEEAVAADDEAVEDVEEPLAPAAVEVEEAQSVAEAPVREITVDPESSDALEEDEVQPSPLVLVEDECDGETDDGRDDEEQYDDARVAESLHGDEDDEPRHWHNRF